MSGYKYQYTPKNANSVGRYNWRHTSNKLGIGWREFGPNWLLGAIGGKHGHFYASSYFKFTKGMCKGKMSLYSNISTHMFGHKHRQ